MRNYLTKKDFIEMTKDMPDDAIIFGTNYAGFSLPLHTDDVSVCKDPSHNSDLDMDFNSSIYISVSF